MTWHKALATLLVAMIVPTFIVVLMPSGPSGYMTWAACLGAALALLAWVGYILDLEGCGPYGAILSDGTLKRRIGLGPKNIYVYPLGEDAIQPASIDVRLGERMLLFVGGEMREETQPGDWQELIPDSDGCWHLIPGNCYLGTTYEHIGIPDDLACQLDGRSSQARRFVSLHEQAGWLDPGYYGKPTLEITVMARTVVRQKQPIGQLVFFKLDNRVQRPYGHWARNSRYQGHSEPTAARTAA